MDESGWNWTWRGRYNQSKQNVPENRGDEEIRKRCSLGPQTTKYEGCKILNIRIPIYGVSARNLRFLREGMKRLGLLLPGHLQPPDRRLDQRGVDHREA